MFFIQWSVILRKLSSSGITEVGVSEFLSRPGAKYVQVLVSSVSYGVFWLVCFDLQWCYFYASVFKAFRVFDWWSLSCSISLMVLLFFGAGLLFMNPVYIMYEPGVNYELDFHLFYLLFCFCWSNFFDLLTQVFSFLLTLIS